MMKFAVTFGTAAMLLAGCSQPSETPAQTEENSAAMDAGATGADTAVATEDGDEFQEFFVWWNEAFKTPGAFTAANFGNYLTPDAKLILEGQTVIDGLDQWAEHFQRIQSGGGDVEIVVPFKTVFREGDKIYTYHVIRSRRDGEVACALAAGHADMVDGKISAITLVRSDLDADEDTLDPQCWTE
ncbi:fimbrillin family protein [Pacificimonas sp. ICDLI1SI03]